MSRSSAAPGRFIKLVVAALPAVAAGAPGRDSALSAADEALVAAGKRIVARAPEMAPPAVPDARRIDEAKAFFERLRDGDPTLREAGRRVEKGRRDGRVILVFLSRSLGKRGLDDAFSALSGRADATAVFRGVPEGMGLGRGIEAIQRLAAGKDPVPNIVIDPTLFRAYDIHVVPSVVIPGYDASPTRPEDRPRPLARVAGLVDPDWLVGAVAGGEKGDFGVRGPVTAITEPDLVEVAGRRLSAIDWEEKKRRARARFWRGRRFIPLPRAETPRIREIDSTVVLSRDLADGDGRVFAHAGERIDPLCAADAPCPPGTRRFTQAVVVFDPLDERQEKTLAAVLPAIRGEPGVRRLTWIATRFDREKGWEGYEAVTGKVDAPVYLLTPEIVSRFALEYTPSVITARAGKFVVRELAEEEE